MIIRHSLEIVEWYNRYGQRWVRNDANMIIPLHLESKYIGYDRYWKVSQETLLEAVDDIYQPLAKIYLLGGVPKSIMIPPIELYHFNYVKLIVYRKENITNLTQKGIDFIQNIEDTKEKIKEGI